VRVLELGYCSLPKDYTQEYSPEAEVLKNYPNHIGYLLEN